MTDTTSAPTQSDARPASVPGGPPAVEEPGMQDGDFGVGENAGDLRTQLLTALESRWNPDDPGATTLEDDAPTTDQPTDPPSADTAATPAPAPQPDADAPLTQDATGGQDGAGGGRAAEDDAGGAATSPPSAPPAPDTDKFDVGAYFNDYFGTPLTREQAAHLASMIGGLQALTPDQRAELDRVLAGGAPNQYPATTGVPVQQPVQPQPAPTDVDPAVAVLGPRPDDEYLAQQWDISARLARANHEQLSTLQQEIARNTQAEMQRQQQAQAVQIEAAQQRWRDEHAGVLSDAEFDALTARAVRSQTFNGLMSSHHGDVNAAVTALYEQQFWADPSLRERAIANLASGRQPGDHTQVNPNSPVAQEQAQVDAGRQQLASSVSGGGGSITPASSGVPTDPDKRKAAMAAEIAAQHDFTS